MATIEYRLELWNPRTRRYDLSWRGSNIDRANIQMDKAYNMRRTRQLLKVTVDQLEKAKAGCYADGSRSQLL